MLNFQAFNIDVLQKEALFLRCLTVVFRWHDVCFVYGTMASALADNEQADASKWNSSASSRPCRRCRSMLCRPAVD